MFVYLRTEIFDMAEKDYTYKQERLARYAKALGNPARIAIMEFLAAQDECFFGQLHEKLPIAKATCSQHLSELKDAGLIKGEIDGLRTRYCIDQENWKECKLLFEEFIAKCPCNRKKQPDESSCKCSCKKDMGLWSLLFDNICSLFYELQINN